MKKTLATFFTGASLALTIVSTSYAQSLNNTVMLSRETSIEKIISSSEEISAIDDSGSIRLNELNARAVRNFTREYKNVPDAKWSKSASGLYIAYFSSEGIKTWVFYTKKGNYLGRGRYYTEDKLPPDIRHRVKSTYYDFDIYYVREVSWDDKSVYLISIENKRSKEKIFYKIIKVVDGGEMEVIKEYSEKVNHEN